MNSPVFRFVLLSPFHLDSQYPENRIRNWNGYMLFYETMDKNRLPRSSTINIQDPRGQIIGDVLR